MQIRSLLRHVSNYSLGSLVVTLAGFISFPILTRLLGVDDYGNMSLVAVTLTFLVAAGKLGLQHSAIMFYSETSAGKNQWNMSQYYSTVMLGMCLSGALVTGCWLIVCVTASGLFWDHPTIVDIFIIASPLILTRVIQSGLNSILRAQERSGLTAIYGVLWRYGNLVFVIGGMLFIEASLKVFFIATVAAETLVLMALAYTVLSRQKIHVSQFSSKLYRYMALFGLPMLGYEMAGIFASIGDRYVIKLVLGAEELGKYAAAYNLSEYVSAIIISSLATAILPMYLRIWSEKGREATEEFLAKSLRLYVFAALPVAFGFSAVADDFIAIMASAAYREGAVTVPYVVMGMIVDGAIIILAAGLYLKKDSKKLLLALCFSSVLNLALNMILVPIMGIKGAAIATLATYSAFAYVAWRLSSQTITIALPWRQVLLYGALSLAMYWIVGLVSIEGEVLSLVSKVCVGGLFYATSVLLLDRDSQKMLKQLRNRGG